MVTKMHSHKTAAASRVRRVMYSTAGLTLVGAAVVVLGAPLKFDCFGGLF